MSKLWQGEKAHNVCLPPSMVYLTCTNFSRQKANWRERETRDRQISLSPSFTLSLSLSRSIKLQQMLPQGSYYMIDILQ